MNTEEKLQEMKEFLTFLKKENISNSLLVAYKLFKKDNSAQILGFHALIQESLFKFGVSEELMNASLCLAVDHYISVLELKISEDNFEKEFNI